MEVIAPNLCTPDGVAHPNIDTGGKFFSEVSTRPPLGTNPQPLKIGSPDSGGYFKLSPNMS